MQVCMHTNLGSLVGATLVILCNYGWVHTDSQAFKRGFWMQIGLHIFLPGCMKRHICFVFCIGAPWETCHNLPANMWYLFIGQRWGKKKYQKLSGCIKYAKKKKAKYATSVESD